MTLRLMIVFALVLTGCGSINDDGGKNGGKGKKKEVYPDYSASITWSQTITSVVAGDTSTESETATAELAAAHNFGDEWTITGTVTGSGSSVNSTCDCSASGSFPVTGVLNAPAPGRDDKFDFAFYTTESVTGSCTPLEAGYQCAGYGWLSVITTMSHTDCNPVLKNTFKDGKPLEFELSWSCTTNVFNGTVTTEGSAGGLWKLVP